MNDYSLEVLWDELSRTRQEIADLKAIEDNLLALIVTKMDKKKKATLDNGVTIERRRSWNRRWDGPALVSRVARQSADTFLHGTTTGEALPARLGDLVGSVVDGINKGLAVSYGRIGALSEMGIDADEYAEKTAGRWNVQMVQIDVSANDTSVVLDEAPKAEG